MAQKVPDIVLKLQVLAKPTFVNGRWRKAAISGRKLAGIRKAMVASGVYWPPKPLADRSTDKPFKLIKHERTRQEREEKIAENMKNMPKMIEEYREKMRALRKATREKKALSEEKKYLQATGQAKTAPVWEMFKDERTKTKTGKEKPKPK